MDNYFRQLKTWLTQQSIKVNDDWLSDCIEYFLTQNKNMPLKTIQDMVYGQWSLADLRDIGIPCLPNTLNSKEILEGCFVLQLQSVQDITVPACDQLEKLYDLQSDPIEDVQDIPVSSPRMLKLELTDGNSYIHALEYKHINCLKLFLNPGTKVKLKGPIKISENILLLEEKNISILGGEVESLLESNSVINVLLRIIGVTTGSDEFKKRFENKRKMKNLISLSKSVHNANASSMRSASTTVKAISQLTPITSVGGTAEEIMNIQDDLNAMLSDDFYDSLSTMSNIEPVAISNSVEKNILSSDYPIKINNLPLVYVKQMNNILTIINKEVAFVIIIKIKEFVEKLCIRNGIWHNVVCVSDSIVKHNEESHNTINVRLHSDIVTNFSGYSVSDMLKLQKSIVDCENTKQDVINRLRLMKERFQNMVFLGHVSVSPSYMGKHPVITKLEELKNIHEEIISIKRNFD